MRCEGVRRLVPLEDDEGFPVIDGRCRQGFENPNTGERVWVELVPCRETREEEVLGA